MAITRVQICGLTRPQDVEAAIGFGADALGFVFESTSPRYVHQDKAKAILKDIPPFVYRVGVFATMYADFLGGYLDACQAIKWALPFEVELRQLQVVRPINGPGKLDEMLIATRPYDAVVLDAYDSGQFGGTGKTVDWDFAAEIVEVLPKPVILAGGLTPDNVGEAIRKVRPYAVDVSSGIESSPGVKDHAKMKDFIQAAKLS